MLKKWGPTGKSLFYKSVLVLWAALEPIGYRIIFQKIQFSTRSTEEPVAKIMEVKKIFTIQIKGPFEYVTKLSIPVILYLQAQCKKMWRGLKC